ncbi:peroxiredoxin-like family protein [Flavobacterium algicola]|uniref:peroxiredoxin-like family protein n=1 Tax=Flavobacterium algicola TaxID=556529 RepID=UPI001EFD60E8|nr:peroxiredoxin-like family protein [Flavobacterium algicola]MCG9793280.1 AhpC/TSA family protein [Flavobacterium algicola]
MSTDNKNTGLQATLDEAKNTWEAKAPEQIKEIYAEGIADVTRQNIIANAKKNDDIAPDFILTNATGQEVQLSDYLKKGPVVLTWYRGGWCPYCNMTLHYLQEQLPNIQAKGANLLALTPELPDKSMSTAEKHDLKFEVLSDVANKVAKEYGIVFKLTDEVAESYQNGFDLHGYNGDESDELPLAATYVIGQDGKIVYTFLDAEYRNRAEADVILKALEGLEK